MRRRFVRKSLLTETKRDAADATFGNGLVVSIWTYPKIWVGKSRTVKEPINGVCHISNCPGRTRDGQVMLRLYYEAALFFLEISKCPVSSTSLFQDDYEWLLDNKSLNCFFCDRELKVEPEQKPNVHLHFDVVWRI